VVVASRGYPVEYETGFPITLKEGIRGDILFAGAGKKDGALVTAGGRVLGVTCRAATLDEAVADAYRDAEKIRFENAYYRRDIGRRALSAPER